MDPTQQLATPQQTQHSLSQPTPPMQITRYSQHPISKNWEPAVWTTSQFGPGRTGVKFPDGQTFDASAVPINAGAEMDQSASTAQATPQPVPASDPPANRETQLNTFRSQLYELNLLSIELFEAPLQVVLQSANRLATANEEPVSGRMAVHDGIAQFEPDQQTFRRWMEGFVQEFEKQRRERGGAEL